MQADHQTRWSACNVRCFPTHSRIQTSHTILSALRVGDVVLARDARADKGRGALDSRRATRQHRKTITDWIHLRWFVSTAWCSDAQSELLNPKYRSGIVK